jgi:hypothetical protein
VSREANVTKLRNLLQRVQSRSRFPQAIAHAAAAAVAPARAKAPSSPFGDRLSPVPSSPFGDRVSPVPASPFGDRVSPVPAPPRPVASPAAKAPEPVSFDDTTVSRPVDLRAERAADPRAERTVDLRAAPLVDLRAEPAVDPRAERELADSEPPPDSGRPTFIPSPMPPGGAVEELIELGPVSEPPPPVAAVEAVELDASDLVEEASLGEAPLTPPPASGSQEVEPAPAPAARHDDLSLSLAPVAAIAPLTAPTDAQLGATIELGESSELSLELGGTPSAPAASQPEAGLSFAPASPSSPPIELASMPPSSSVVLPPEPEIALATPLPPAAEPVAAPAPAPAEPEEVHLVAEAAPAEVAAAVVRREVVRGAAVAAFVGQARGFEPGSFGELLDASLGLGGLGG